MSDFDFSDPPRYLFGLFGHRASGKSVYVLSLGAARRPETGFSNVEFLSALPPGAAEDNAPSLSAEEVEHTYAEALAALKLGQLPAQTDPVHGNLRYAFELVRPASDGSEEGAGARARLDISDHAGELVNRLTNEADKAAVLRAFLAERDGLILVAEAPRPTDDPAARQKALSEVTELSSRLAQVLEDQPLESLRCRSAVLLVTKWDRVHPFDGFQREGESAGAFRDRLAAEEARHAALFEAWMETPAAAEHRRLLDDLRARLGAGAVRAYPVTAFGEAQRRTDPATGRVDEVPARLPLATLNVVAPLSFLLERTDALMREALLKRAAADDPGGRFQFWRLQDVLRTERPELPAAGALRPRFGDDAELSQALARAHHRRRKARMGQSLTALACLTGVFFLGSGVVGTSTAQRHVAVAEAALATPALEELIAADRLLADRFASNSRWPWVVSQHWVLGDEALRDLRARLEEAECAQWAVVVTRAVGRRDLAAVELFRERIADAPRCADVADNLGDREREWQEEAQLTAIGQLLNDYDFVRAVEVIFGAAREGAVASSALRNSLTSLDSRFNDWETARDRDPVDVLVKLVPILGALTSPPPELADAVVSLRERLDERREALEILRDCAEFSALRQRAVGLSRPPQGNWPALHRIDALMGDIAEWRPGHERSEFRDAAGGLRWYADELKRLRIRGVSSSGALEGARRVSDAELTVTVSGRPWAAQIDMRRGGPSQLSATIESSHLHVVDLGSTPQFSVELELPGRRVPPRRSQTWSGNLGGLGPSTWEALRDHSWSVAIPLMREGTEVSGGPIRIEVLLAPPPGLPKRADPPAVCSQ